MKNAAEKTQETATNGKEPPLPQRAGHRIGLRGAGAGDRLRCGNAARRGQDRTFAATVTSSDESILRVDYQNHRLQALAPGTATVTATLGDKSDARQIMVYPVDSAAGSTLRVSPAVIEITGDSEMQVSVTATMTFGPKVKVMNTHFLVNPGVVSHDSAGEWTKIADRTYSKEFQFTIDPQKLSGQTSNGILIYMMCKDGDDSYDLKRDIMDYAIVQVLK